MALVLQHCPSTSHSHSIQSWPETAEDSFVAPAHEYPSHLELRLTATDSGGLLRTGRPEATADRLHKLLDELEPTAARLGCADELGGARGLIEVNGAQRQRAGAGSGGARVAAAWLAERFPG